MILLDEPAAGLNVQETEALADVIRAVNARGITVVLIEHDMSLIMKVAQRIAVLDFGRKIAEGTPDEIKAHPDCHRRLSRRNGVRPMSETVQLLQSLVNGVGVGLIYGLVGIGFCVIYNASGIVNFAQGVFVMLGGMICHTLLTRLGLPIFVAAVLDRPDRRRRSACSSRSSSSGRCGTGARRSSPSSWRRSRRRS